MYRWELDGPADQEFADLDPAVQTSLAAFMDAVVIVDPMQYQRHRDERDDVSMPLRTLHFGQHGEGLVTFLVYPLMTSYSLPGSSGSERSEPRLAARAPPSRAPRSR